MRRIIIKRITGLLLIINATPTIGGITNLIFEESFLKAFFVIWKGQMYLLTIFIGMSLFSLLIHWLLFRD